jgi:membrane-associated protease RseP (regulator of RpoE activity)
MLVYAFFAFIGISAALVVHEVGHLIVARCYGVRVLRLSGGLGPEIAGFTDRHGTRWSLSAVPLGASLQMNDDRGSAGAAEAAFSTKTVGQRAIILGAGPIANLGFAIVTYVCSVAFFWPDGLLSLYLERPEAAFACLLIGLSGVVGLCNILPIPPLDGGLIALLGIEAFTRHPIPDRIKRKICVIGMVFVIFLSTFALAIGMLQTLA